MELVEARRTLKRVIMLVITIPKMIILGIDKQSQTKRSHFAHIPYDSRLPVLSSYSSV